MATQYSRRQILRAAAFGAAAPTVLPMIGRAGLAFGDADVDPATALRNRLVGIFLYGGNDGLNTVIPIGDADGTQRLSVYRQTRPTLRYEPSAVLPLDRPGDADHALGLHPSLTKIHGMYRDGRVAVVQGVDYPNHSYSHFISTDIWHSGQPVSAPDSGWVGRHLDRAGIGEGELRGLAIGSALPLLLQGRDKQGVNIPGVPFKFADGTAAVAETRHNALDQFALHPVTEPLRLTCGKTFAAADDVVDATQAVTAPPNTTNALLNSLLAGRAMLEGSFGVESLIVGIGGYDTHVSQKAAHQTLMTNLDTAVNTFLNGDSAAGIAPLAASVADRTLILVISEFGRRLGENGSGGTDHGAAAPVFLIGPAGGRLVPGLHGDHPDVGTTAAPADNLFQTTDVRAVLQSVLQEWLGDAEPELGSPLAGLIQPTP